MKTFCYRRIWFGNSKRNHRSIALYRKKSTIYKSYIFKVCTRTILPLFNRHFFINKNFVQPSTFIMNGKEAPVFWVEHNTRNFIKHWWEFSYHWLVNVISFWAWIGCLLVCRASTSDSQVYHQDSSHAE